MRRRSRRKQRPTNFESGRGSSRDHHVVAIRHQVDSPVVCMEFELNFGVMQYEFRSKLGLSRNARNMDGCADSQNALRAPNSRRNVMSGRVHFRQ